MDELIKMYPFNLAKDIFGNDEKVMEIYIPGISTALDTLTEKERNILHDLYANHMTLKACGLLHSLTPTRIAQIRNNALHELRWHSNKLIRGMSISEYDNLKASNELLEKEISVITESHKDAKEIKMMLEHDSFLNSSIRILNLTNRTYDALLCHARCCTIRDIVNMTYDTLINIPTIGTVCAEDVVNCLSKFGLELRKEE